jgi:hypothetical protein
MSTVAPVADPERPANPPAAPAWSAPLFVWGVLALALLADMVFVGQFGLDFPNGDEWVMAPVLTGEQPLTLDWLWAQVNEHRVPLPKLVLLASYRVTGYDFRAAMFFNVFGLGALAAALVLAARTLRGRIAYVDAFFPLALLHWGQYEEFLWGWQVDQVLPGVLAASLPVFIVRGGTRLTLKTAVLVGACLLSLPLCGAMGLPYVPLLALWLAYSGVRTWFSSGPHRRRDGLLAVAFALAALFLVGLYFQGYETTTAHPPSPGLRASLKTGAQFLSLNFGLAAIPLWPFSALAMVGLGLLGVAALVLVWVGQPQDRGRALGLLSFLASTAVLTLGIGWGRAGLGETAGFAPRYVVLAVPALCGLYIVWVLYHGPTARLAQMVLFTLVCGAFFLNVHLGLEGAKTGQKVYLLEAFDQDLRDRVSPNLLAERYTHVQTPWLSPEEFAVLLEGMKQAGIGRFGALQSDPACREVLIPVRPIAVNQMTWDAEEGIGRGDGGIDPFLVFRLREPQFVHAVRLKYSYEDAHSPANFQMFWRRTDSQEFVETERTARLELRTDPGERVVTVRVNDTIDAIRIDPDTKSCVFKLVTISLLVPVEGDFPDRVGFGGVFDVVAEGCLYGWAWDPRASHQPISVDIYDGEDLLATVLADQFREDLRQAGVGNGRHGFAYPVPAQLQDGQDHTIRIRVAGSSVELEGSRKILRIPP